MIPEKSILEQLLEWLKTLPTWLKNAIVITGLLAGFVVSFRADKYLYTVIVIGIGILYISGLATYILLKRDPSPFGGQGAYKYYQYRFLAKGVLIAMLVGTIF